MLKITIPETEEWDEREERFIFTKGQTIQLEHSLLSISKWESKWHKPFLSKERRTNEETIDYIKCMTITQNVDPNLYSCLTNDNINEINNYIDDPMSATFFNDEPSSRSKEVVTSELIYYWMISLNIPVEFQKWHLNRLLTLIRVCNLKNTPPKKRSVKEIMSRNAALNEQRKRELNTRG